MLSKKSYLLLVALCVCSGATALFGQTIPRSTPGLEDSLLSVLASNAPYQEKAAACRQLGTVGTGDHGGEDRSVGRREQVRERSIGQRDDAERNLGELGTQPLRIVDGAIEPGLRARTGCREHRSRHIEHDVALNVGACVDRATVGGDGLGRGAGKKPEQEKQGHEIPGRRKPPTCRESERRSHHTCPASHEHRRGQRKDHGEADESRSRREEGQRQGERELGHAQ